MIRQAKFIMWGLLIMICMIIILQVLILWETGQSKTDDHLLSNVYNLVHMYGIITQIIEKFEKNNTLKETLTIQKRIELSYLLIFYGCSGENSIRMITSALKPFDRFLTDKNSTFGALIVKELTHYKTVADGFQANLGHYFRHLFQTVIYIHNQSILTPEEKNFYIKRLRAQFSNHEIAILFLNSFALGKRWTSYHSSQYPNKTDLITTYRLIQNLPAQFFASFDFRCFFPEIIYEGDLHKFSQTKEYKNCNNTKN